eukprot:gene11025-59258_t
MRSAALLLPLLRAAGALYRCDNGHRAANGTDAWMRPAYHFYPSTIESQDISGPIK